MDSAAVTAAKRKPRRICLFPPPLLMSPKVCVAGQAPSVSTQAFNFFLLLHFQLSSHIKKTLIASGDSFVLCLHPALLDPLLSGSALSVSGGATCGRATDSPMSKGINLQAFGGAVHTMVLKATPSHGVPRSALAPEAQIGLLPYICCWMFRWRWLFSRGTSPPWGFALAKGF